MAKMKKDNADITNLPLVEALIVINKKIDEVVSFVEGITNKFPEIIILTIYFIGRIIVGIFHEPWYDEAVAWQIAKSASLCDIIFEIPHYEGHPPLWHLILLPFVKLGMPYEFSLKFVSLVFSGSAVILLVFKSPFPRIIRLLLPFTYFLFYQYGVISRPYSVMILLFFVMALVYKERNNKPWKYTIVLALLCFISAYGILLSAGLAIVWLWEIWDKRSVFEFLKSFLKDKRIHCLVCLLVFALCVIFLIFPQSDTLATSGGMFSININKQTIFVFLYMFLGLFSDLFFTNIYSVYTTVNGVNFDEFSLLCGCFLGGILWVGAYVFSKKKSTFATLVVPQILFSLFGLLVYLSPHHIGISFLFILFWLWITIEKGEVSKESKKIEKYKILSSSFVKIMCCVSLVITLFWNFSSSLYDLNNVYAIGRNEAEFIKENNLDEYKIMCSWSFYENTETGKVSINTNEFITADNIVAYFSRNIFFNFNSGRDDMSYSTHRVASKKENNKNISEWQKIRPDVLYMRVPIEYVYDGDFLNMRDFSLVYENEAGKVWKGLSEPRYSEIYVRNDLLEELGLKPLNVE